MPESSTLTAIVLTLNEEKHIARCINSLRGVVDRIVVVDSGSTDNTRAIAVDLGATVLEHPFHSYAAQFNWALDNVAQETRWILRIDADEYIPADSGQLLRLAVDHAPPGVNGFTLRLQRVFMGRLLRHGALGSIHLLRVWRNGAGRCESRHMDEHVQVDGRVVRLRCKIVDHNLNDITWWTTKHNHYATREMQDIAERQVSSLARVYAQNGRQLHYQARLKRALKHQLYLRLPLSSRAFAYFIYRYILRLGFLDGRPGFYFHVLQGFWYRFLVDVKLWEAEQNRNPSGEAIRAPLDIDTREAPTRS